MTPILTYIWLIFFFGLFLLCVVAWLVFGPKEDV